MSEGESFDQFHALRQRKRAAGEPVDGGEARSKGDAAAEGEQGGYSVRETVGDFVEKFEVQLVVIVLIALDVIAVTADFFIAHTDLVDREMQQVVTAMQLLQSFMGFTIFFFLIEIGLVFFAFSEACLSHFGYMLDAGLICAGLYWEINMGSKVVRLLGLLRVWRVVRLVNSLLAAAGAKHEGTRQLLLQEQKVVEQLEDEKTKMEEGLKQEAAARQRVDAMLQGYKDEVETLSEALNIAAMNAAETRFLDEEDDDFLDELGREGAEGGDDDGFDMVGLAEEAEVDDEGFAEASDTSTGQSGGKFVVSKDGSYTRG